MSCPSCDRDLSCQGKPGHECYTYAEHSAAINDAKRVRVGGPTTPCVSCNQATPLGGNTVTHYGQLGDMCSDCSLLWKGPA